MGRLLLWLQRRLNNGGNSYFASSPVPSYYFFLFLTSATYYKGKQGLNKQVSDPSTEISSCAHLPLKKNHVQRPKDQYLSQKPHIETAVLRSVSKVAGNINRYVYLNVIRNTGIFHKFIFSNS